MKNSIGIILTFLIFISTVEAVAESKWYSLSPKEEYVSDFVIKANSVKDILIKSNIKQKVMFRVDMTGEKMDTIMRGPFPIEMIDIDSKKSISSFYGGFDIAPVNGQIQLKFSNKGPKEYKVLVVKTKQ